MTISMIIKNKLSWLVVFVTLACAAAPMPIKADDENPTVAVLYFDGAENDSLASLSKGLSQMLITDLADNDAIRVVERIQLQALLAEQNLIKSGKVDRSTAVRLGKLLGAQYLVLGSYFGLQGKIRLDARIVEVETGKIVRTAGAMGDINDFWNVEQKLVADLEDGLSVKLPDAFKKRVQKKRKHRKKKTKKMKTTVVANYSKALDKIDKGDKKGAKKLLTKVTKEHPDFRLAALDLARLLK